MPQELSEFQQRFWNPERIAVLKRRWASYDTSVDVAATINAVPWSAPVTVHDCQQMAAHNGWKRPFGFGSVMRARILHAANPKHQAHVDALIKSARAAGLVHQREERQRAIETKAAAAVTEAKAVQARAERASRPILAMKQNVATHTDMGRPPSRPFSMLAMGIPDPTVARVLRDRSQARDKIVNPASNRTKGGQPKE